MAMIRAHLDAGTRVEMTNGRSTWVGDEPVGSGGTDAGPEPYEQLLGALASCINMTLRIYSDYKGIPLESVDTSIEFDRVHADDCMECDVSDRGLLDRIRTKVVLRGEFNEAQRKRLTQVAGRCPVHKTMSRGIQIFDSVFFEAPSTVRESGE